MRINRSEHAVLYFYLLLAVNNNSIVVFGGAEKSAHFHVTGIAVSPSVNDDRLSPSAKFKTQPVVVLVCAYAVDTYGLAGGQQVDMF